MTETMAAAASFTSLTISSLHALPRSAFLGKNKILITQNLNLLRLSSNTRSLAATAKFNLFEVLGGRGLCNGEQGLLKELETPKSSLSKTSEENSPDDPTTLTPPTPGTTSSLYLGEGSFEKELLGLTGGFPGGEKGLVNFIEKNPPPKKTKGKDQLGSEPSSAVTEPNSPEPPLLMPGMIVIVKNEDNPYHMYCGIVQRVTDGMVGVLFEGGNWDKLITFRMNDLERREKGPPMVNPKSAVLEAQMEENK